MATFLHISRLSVRSTKNNLNSFKYPPEAMEIVIYERGNKKIALPTFFCLGLRGAIVDGTCLDPRNSSVNTGYLILKG